jgi:glycosyltransferase involved in cell wall biosynthesis
MPTALLIGLTVSRLSGLPLVADLRDAMVDDKHPLEPLRRKIYQWIERRVCAGASKVVFTAEGTRAMYRQRFPELPDSRWAILPNGYDEEMFSGTVPSRRTPAAGAKRVLLHSGLIYPSERDPKDFFAAVKQLVDSGKISPERLEIRLRATGHDDRYQAMIDAAGLSEIIRIEPPLDYREALAEMFTVDGLLVLQGASCNHQVPAKVYEYLRAGTPILGITDPLGDTGKLMSQFGVRHIAALDDSRAIATSLQGFLRDLDDAVVWQPDALALARFSRQSQAGDLAKLLSGVVRGAASGGQ